MSEPLFSPRLAPETSAVDHHDDIPSLAEVARFLLRYRWWIAGAALLVAIASFVVVRWGTPPRYRAVATLIVVPPRLPDGLQPRELPIQAYERLVASDAVLAETRRRLAEEDSEGAAQRLQPGEDLRIRLSVSERTQVALAPILELVAFSPRPEQAATIANTWSAAFLEHWALLTEGSLEGSTELLASELSAARDELVRLEEQTSAEAGEGEGVQREVEGRWDQRISAAAEEASLVAGRYRRDTTAAVGAYNAETRRSLQGLVAEGLPSSGELSALIAHVVSLRARLAQSPEVVLLERVDGGSEARPDLWRPPAVVREEELNLSHAEVSLRIAELESQIDALLDPGTAEPVRPLLVALESAQYERAAGLRDLQEERQLGLDRLQRRQLLTIEELRRGRQRELVELARRRQLADSELARELAPAQQLFDRLSRSLGDAELAESSRARPDVRLASAASPPVTAQPRRAGFYGVVGLVLGGLMGVVVAAARELARRRPEDPT